MTYFMFQMCNIHGLQKICDTLSEHPSWSLAHLAAHFALYDSFSNPKINCFLNSTDVDTGMSPLQVAISTQNLKTIQIMVFANCSLEHLDYEANSVFHYAASTTKEIISVSKIIIKVCIKKLYRFFMWLIYSTVFINIFILLVNIKD